MHDGPKRPRRTLTPEIEAGWAHLDASTKETLRLMYELHQEKMDALNRLEEPIAARRLRKPARSRD
jgi:hypothetical protein